MSGTGAGSGPSGRGRGQQSTGDRQGRGGAARGGGRAAPGRGASAATNEQDTFISSVIAENNATDAQLLPFFTRYKAEPSFRQRVQARLEEAFAQSEVFQAVFLTLMKDFINGTNTLGRLMDLNLDFQFRPPLRTLAPATSPAALVKRLHGIQSLTAILTRFHRNANPQGGINIRFNMDVQPDFIDQF